MAKGSAQKIFVTGGTGFVGQALVQDLLRTNRDVVLLTRNPKRVATDLYRRVNVVQGDLENPQSYDDCLRGCDAVVHCAKAVGGDPVARARLDVKASRNLMNTAISAGLRRFVHLSTISVYGTTDCEFVDERSPRKSNSDHYASSKVQIEEELRQKNDAIELVILQPANIYGPAPCWWSHSLINMMRRGKIIMVNEGQGLANMVHVADVIQSIGSALDADCVQGECFIISDGKPVTWREYFGRLEGIVGHEATLPLTASKAKEISRRLMDRSFAARIRRSLGRVFLNQPLTFPLTDDAIDKYASRTTFSIAKAEEYLHYKPIYDLDTGLKTVEEYETSHLRAGPARQFMPSKSLAPRKNV